MFLEQGSIALWQTRGIDMKGFFGFLFFGALFPNGDRVIG